MRNSRFIKKILLLFFLLFSINSYTQFTINTYNNGWIMVNGGNGAILKNSAEIQLHLNGPLNYKKWSVVARVVSPIINSENKEFPVEKLNFKFSNYTTQQYYAENYPTITQLGLIQNTISLSYNPVYFIKNSPLKVTIPSGRYGMIQLTYDIIIASGNYLNNLKSWNSYPIRMEFNIINEYGQIIATSPFTIGVQISPEGNYDVAPTFSISVNNSAINGELIFNTIQDYRNGVRKEYQDGLNVSSDTPYEIQVSSTNQYLKANSSENLELNLIKVQIKDTETGRLSNQVRLSDYNQTLYSSSVKSKGKKYNIIYSTSPAEEKILNSKPGNYSTSLQYTIIPL